MKTIILFLCLICATAFSAIAAMPAILTGKVTDQATKQPLSGATLVIPDIKVSAVTNANGEYTFTSVPNRGKLLVEVHFMGYKTISRMIDFATPSPDFALEPSTQEMHEVVITGSPVSAGNKQSSTSVTVLTRAQLLNSSANLVDALAKQVPGVSQITTGQAISKPVIRGLGFNRVVTLNDGVKQQGQQWGEEHGIEIDQFAPEKVEVLRGAASLLYGSDALGGVINFIEPVAPPEGTVKGELLSNYSTNNGLTSSSLMLSGNDAGWVWLGRGTYKNAYSFKTPTGYFPNSGYNEADLSGRIGVNRKWGYSHLNLSYFKTNIGFYEPSFNAAGDYLDDDGNTYTPDAFKNRTPDFPRQNIGHYKVGWNSNILLGSGYLKADFGFQKNQRKELDGPDPTLFFDLNTYSADLKYYLPQVNDWQRVLGLSADEGHSLNKGAEVLVPDYDTFGLGVFGFAKKTWESSTFNIGLRYDYRSNTGKALTDAGTVIFAPFKNSFSNLSAALGFTHELTEHIDFKANAGSAFRAPNPPELGSNGVHEGTFRYEVGNPQLDPERSYQADATLDFTGKTFSGSLGVYTHTIHNYIYASNKPGDNITVDDGNGPVTYPVYRYGQVNANLYGLEGSVVLHLGSFVHFENSFGYTHAQNTTLNRPLSFIPAGNLHHELRFEPGAARANSSYFSVSVDNFFSQNRVDLAFETPTAGYALFNAGIGTTIKMGRQSLKLSLSGNNLADKKYYSALSRLKPGRLDQTDPSLGVYDPGRNITIGVYLPFNL